MDDYLREKIAKESLKILALGVFGTMMYVQGHKAGYNSGYEEGSRQGRGFFELSQQAMRQNIRVMNEINRQSSEFDEEEFDD